MEPTQPVWISPLGDLAAHGPEAGDSWWFCSSLTEGTTRFAVKIHAMVVGESCASSVAIRREDTGETTARSAVDKLSDVTLSTDAFDVRTSLLSLRGDTDDLVITGETGDARVRLALRREGPALYNDATGRFPFFGGATYQYAMPNLLTSGTINEHEVTGGTWFDRQWFSGARTAPVRFTWLGLNLGDGHHLSVWDTVGDGSSWVTALRPDGTHTVAAATRTGGGGRWRLVVPALDADVTIDHRQLDLLPSFYTGVCDVVGSFGGRDVEGRGFTDIIG